tara:strand:- start:320 stop:1507 length:1188 start_codon:yes stop_codon:yes gene_type:complete
MDEIDDDFNTDAFKRAIAEIESSGGKNLSNKYSSAAGKYHFLYRHIKRDPLLKGVSKREFMANSDLQEQVMDKAIRGDLKGYASYKDGASKLKKEFGSELRTDQIAALTHFLGPTGTKRYLEDPENYKVSGKNNATVQQYIDRYDSYYQPKDGDSIFIEGKIKNNEVKYGTPEYKRLYDEGSIMGVSQDGTPFQNLDQVVVNGSEKYKTSENEKVLDTNYIDSTLNANKDKRWVERMFENNPKDILLEGQTQPSTHFIESGDSKVYPRVMEGDDGQLKEVSREEGMSQAIEFPDDKTATWFGENYKQGTNVLKEPTVTKEYQMGGNMTGDPVNGSLAEEGKLTEFEGGGTHEENPIGGIPQGLASNGKMNTVEEGESKYKFKKTGDYIFSNRIKL